MSDQPDGRTGSPADPARSDRGVWGVEGGHVRPPIFVTSLSGANEPAGGAPGTSPATGIASAPPDAGRGAIVTTATVAVLAVAAGVAATLRDLRAPTLTDWHIITVLGVIAVIAILIGYRYNPPDDDSAPPWDVHTVWLLPGALLTPPAAFASLVALSLAVGLVVRAHPLRWRIVVASITVLTTAAVHAAAQLFSNFTLSAVVGIAALWIIGAVIAVTVGRVIGTPSGTVLWLDDRWTLVELGCAFSGMLIAAVMRTDPYLGLAGLAPLLFAAFALRWPELNRHARIDPKTGLPNAWHWEERTRELLAAAEIIGTPVTVVIIDIDRFKLVNDTYGHLTGDRVLADLADALRDEVHPGDLMGRFGGEEFVMTMFGLPPVVTVAAAERIRSRVAGQRHRVTGARANDWCTITCTIGLASSTAHGYDLTRLLDMADVALSSGKAAGRNQVRDAAEVLADIGADEDETHARADSRSLWALITRPRNDRRTLRHGPGSMLR